MGRGWILGPRIGMAFEGQGVVKLVPVEVQGIVSTPALNAPGFL